MESTDNMGCFCAAIKDEPDWDHIDLGIVKKEVPSLIDQTSKADIKIVECLEFTSDTAPNGQVKVETLDKEDEDMANDWPSLQLTDTKDDVKHWTVSSSAVLSCVVVEGGLEKLREGIKTAYTGSPRNSKERHQGSEVACTYKEHTDSHQIIKPQTQSIDCGTDKNDITITPSVIVITPGGHTPWGSTGGLTPGRSTGGHTPGVTTREHTPGGSTLSKSCASMKTPESGRLFLSPRLTLSPPGGSTAQSITHEESRLFDDCAKKSKQGNISHQPSTGTAANKQPRSSKGKHSKVVPKRKKLALKEKCPCKCPVCGHSFPSEGLLLRHKQRHNNGEPYQCSVCQKLFCVKTTFHRHQLVHVWDEVKQVYDPL